MYLDTGVGFFFFFCKLLYKSATALFRVTHLRSLSDKFTSIKQGYTIFKMLFGSFHQSGTIWTLTFLDFLPK